MKYLFYSDIQYLLNKRKKIFILLLFVPLIISLINANVKGSLLEISTLNMGAGIDLTSFSIIEFIAYIFNISIYVFLLVDVYIKDIKYQLDNIFLRETPFKWYIKKSCLFLFILLILKTFQYIIVITIALIFNNIEFNINILSLILTDYLYIGLIGYLFLLVYLLIKINYKLKFLPIVFGIVMFTIIPKNIYAFNNKIIYMIFILIFIELIIGSLFKKYNKNLIQNLKEDL